VAQSGGHISEVWHPAGVPEQPPRSSGGRFPLALTTTGYPLPTLRVGLRQYVQQKMSKLQTPLKRGINERQTALYLEKGADRNGAYLSLFCHSKCLKIPMILALGGLM
jgi:hypothetical protein